jgi:hypothetical protein
MYLLIINELIILNDVLTFECIYFIPDFRINL